MDHCPSRLLDRPTAPRRAAWSPGTSPSASHGDRGAQPHDDTVLPPLWIRGAQSPGSQLELFAVLTAAALVPLGWIFGRLLHLALIRLIPGTLRGYPIPALLWADAVLGLLVVLLYDPGTSLGGTSLGQMLTMPWIGMQLTATPVVAGVYGIAEGWLSLSPARTVGRR